MGVVSEGVWQEVCRRMEKGVEKLGWVHQGNVRQVTGEYRSLQIALKGTGWGAAEAAWAWIADRQAQGDVRIDGRMGRMTTGKGKDPVWNWEWQVRAKAGRGGEGLSVDMIEWHRTADRIFNQLVVKTVGVDTETWVGMSEGIEPL